MPNPRSERNAEASVLDSSKDSMLPLQTREMSVDAPLNATDMQRSMPLLTRKLQLNYSTCACACLESFVENDAEQLNG